MGDDLMPTPLQGLEMCVTTDHSHFSCDEGTKCFPAELRCDGIIQCDDYSDEFECKKTSGMLELLLPLMIGLVGLVCVLLAAIFVCRWRSRRQKKRVTDRDAEVTTGVTTCGGEGMGMGDKLVEKPEKFTLAHNGNSLWAGHPEYYYTD